ncbi:copper-translocating P-type ATPase [Rhodothermaceae bacterium RA]|nr:copper-translocating P-type ATPase [Rhodothermaceae bacterium RA]
MDAHAHHHTDADHGNADHGNADHGNADHGNADHGNAGHDHHAHMVADYRRRFFVSLVVTIPILLLSPMIQGWLGIGEALAFPGDRQVLLALSAFVYGYGGWPFLTGLVRELRDRRPGMMTLVALAITVAFVYSAAVVFGLEGKLFFWETATLVDLMLAGHWIEMRSVMSASRALEELAALMPKEAHRITERGETEDVPVTDLRPGDRVRIRANEQIPADGRIVEGRSSLNESLLTGESKPVEKGEGDEVIAGAINGAGTLVVEVEKTGEDSYLNQVIRLVREAQQSKSRTQHLADRAAFYLTLIALASGAITFGVWLTVRPEDLTFAIERAVTVMVITCPHALGLAIPLVVAVSTSLGARRGLLIRNRAAFERARHLDTMVFDKTGTLTEGRFGVTDIRTFGDADEDELLRLAAAVEQHSEHPIAAGIVRSAEERGLDLPDTTDFASRTGEGVEATVDGQRIRVLSPGAVERAGLRLPDHDADALSEQGKTVVYVVRDDTPIGALALADVIRDASKEAVQMLHDLGIDVVMLTGDDERVARYVAREIGVDRVLAEILPDEKADQIEQLQQEGRVVAMTGDGVNDAPALATADVGIAIGAGTDVAVETADIVLVESDPRDAVDIIRLSKATYRKMVQNLWYAAGYNIVAIPLAAGVLFWAGIILSPAVGAVLMSLSTVVVAINARLLSVG